MASPEELVVVYVGDFSRAGHLKNLLEAEGITAFIKDEVTSTLYPVTGGAKVMVAQKDIQRARPIVHQFEEDFPFAVRRRGATPKKNHLWSLLALAIPLIPLMWFSCAHKLGRGNVPSDLAARLRQVDTLYDEGRYDEAIRAAQQALQYAEEPPQAPDRMKELCLWWVGRLYDAEGKEAEAEPIFQRLLLLKEKRWGTHSVNLVDTLFTLAVIQRDLGKHEEAAALYRRVIEIREPTYGVEDRDVLLARWDLARTYEMLGGYQEAEPIFQAILPPLQRKFGVDHVRVAEVVQELAFLKEHLGDYTTAESLYQQWIHMQEKHFGVEGLPVAVALDHYAVLLRKAGKGDQAVELETRAKGIRSKHIK